MARVIWASEKIPFSNMIKYIIGLEEGVNTDLVPIMKRVVMTPQRHCFMSA